MSVQRLHVAVDARMSTDAGIGTYLQQLVPRLAAARPGWRFTALGHPDRLRSLGWDTLRNLDIVSCTARVYSLAEQIDVPKATPRTADILFVPHYNIPMFGSKRLVVTVQDVCHLALPDSTPGPAARLYAKGMFRWIRRNASAVIFPSQFSRSEMERVVGTPNGRTFVTPLGVDAFWWSGAKTNGNGDRVPYVVSVGSQKRHKNLPALMRAFSRVSHRIPHRLLLIGRALGLNADPEIAREAANVGDRVRMLGEVDGATLRMLVAGADAMATTSLYEGFGFPPLEAMAAGVPCVVSRAGSLPEVCGDAALYCDPRDESSIGESLIRITTDTSLRDELRARGAERVKLFEWARCAETTALVLEQAAYASNAG